MGGFQRRTKGQRKRDRPKGKKGVKTGLNRAITRVPRSMYYLPRYLRTEVRRVISVTVVDAELNRDIPRAQR